MKRVLVESEVGEVVRRLLREEVAGWPSVIVERVEGVDLGEAYPGLTAEERRGVAREVARVQGMVARGVPAGRGYGYSTGKGRRD